MKRELALCGAVAFGLLAGFAAEEGIAAFDPRMAAEKAVVDTNGIKWIDGPYLPIEGRAFSDVDDFYDRLPSGVTSNVNRGVRVMKHHTAGLQARFATDSKFIEIRWAPLKTHIMDHMPQTGSSSVDVYRRQPGGKWTYCATGRIRGGEHQSLRRAWTPGEECLVNFPLYNGVKYFRVGISTNATIRALPKRASGIDRPVVFYGTSITHGGCCSRPGMSFVNIVGRDLDVPVVNLGFSGSGRMEFEMSEHLARINASCYVLDCLWNMNKGKRDDYCCRDLPDPDDPLGMVKTRYEPFIRNLRRLRPDVPIVMAEQCDVFMNPPQAKDLLIRALYEKLIAEGWKNLVYLPKSEMYPGDGEGTVDGCHPNDYGMMTMAKAFGKGVREAIWGKGAASR